MALMETHIAPPVVAVIVTHDPGEWFEETLRAFGAQDYPELSILILDSGSSVDPTPRVADVLPGAFVRVMPTNKGFGATANEVLAIEDCMLASEPGNLARRLGASWCAEQGLSAWERGRGPAGRGRGDVPASGVSAACWAEGRGSAVAQAPACGRASGSGGASRPVLRRAAPPSPPR